MYEESSIRSRSFVWGGTACMCTRTYVGERKWAFTAGPLWAKEKRGSESESERERKSERTTLDREANIDLGNKKTEGHSKAEGEKLGEDMDLLKNNEIWWNAKQRARARAWPRETGRKSGSLIFGKFTPFSKRFGNSNYYLERVNSFIWVYSFTYLISILPFVLWFGS